MLHVALHALLGKARLHRSYVERHIGPRRHVDRPAAHVKEVQVKQGQLLPACLRVVQGAMAEVCYLGVALVRPVVELDKLSARGGAGCRALANLHEAVGDVGRKVALAYLYDDDAPVIIGRIGDKPHLKRRHGRHMPLA